MSDTIRDEHQDVGPNCGLREGELIWGMAQLSERNITRYSRRSSRVQNNVWSEATLDPVCGDKECFRGRYQISLLSNFYKLLRGRVSLVYIIQLPYTILV